MKPQVETRKQQVGLMKILLTLLCSLAIVTGAVRVGAGQSTVIAAQQEHAEFIESMRVVINGNEPYFSKEMLVADAYESYSALDSLGRCGPAIACVGKELMPTEARGDIGSVTPTGWHSVKYEEAGGDYLYNRCHLIGYQLTAENANKQNLVTGTRCLNVQGMLSYENKVADFVKETGMHVLYRVTPIFEGNNLVCTGVLLEAKSVEDEGDGICFNVFVYNAQPQIGIDYATGDSWFSKEGVELTAVDQIECAAMVGRVEEQEPEESTEAEAEEAATENDNQQEMTFILNTNSKKYHDPSCSGVARMSEKNKEEYYGSEEELAEQGYAPCGTCMKK